jgi:hypothetical protein
MSLTSRASATSLVIGLIFFVSGVNAQTYSGELQTATGEIWPSIEPYTQVPREGLELAEPSQPGDLEIATGDVWSWRQNAPAPQALVPAIVLDQVHGPMPR